MYTDAIHLTMGELIRERGAQSSVGGRGTHMGASRARPRVLGKRSRRPSARLTHIRSAFE